jgi:hypothetical protein
MIWPGNEYRDKQTGHLVHCQDVDRIKRLALVGVSDENGIWDRYWTDTVNLEEVDRQAGYRVEGCDD